MPSPSIFLCKVLSQRPFSKPQLYKGIFPISNFPSLSQPQRLDPLPVLAEALDPQPFSDAALSPISACGTSERLTKPFPLRKFHILKIATWKVARGKMSFRKYLTLIFLRKTIEHIYVPDIQHCFHIYFGKLSKSDRQCQQMVIHPLVIYPLLESKCVNNAY